MNRKTLTNMRQMCIYLPGNCCLLCVSAFLWFCNVHVLYIFSLFCRDIDKVDDLMADITEQQEIAAEISDVISRPVGFGEDYDEVRLFFILLC